MTAPVISPARYDAVIFDLDGVVTDTASVHAAAWRRLFDYYLASRPSRAEEDQFTDEDYRRYVDGRSRYDGVRAFLASRGITEDPAVVRALGDRKDEYFVESVKQHGVRVFDGTVVLLRSLRAAGMRVAIISASRNCVEVLKVAGMDAMFDVRVDGVVAGELGLPGKPDPAVFLEAARRLHVAPNRTVVVEDALAGVASGRRGRFGLVIGVDRTGHPDELRAAGADLVVKDLAEVALPTGVAAATPRKIDQ
ncbi:MAG TPA: beta-phosphoglucomutase family hydrolase [Jiangellaceae bacterium]|nr:beta-phosphoglucomutase family hydrolase [Jiangellaceae bacterium]